MICFIGILQMLGPPSAGAEPASLAQTGRSAKPAGYAGFVTEASVRFGIPEDWIRSVIEVESDGKMNAISPRGALGLMQIMPQTWIELSARYDLGLDPFDAHDNILAGTAYLREMLDRFGAEGFLAAYNAGPKRFEEHLLAGRPLPDETQIYVRRLTALLGIGGNDHRRAISQIDDKPQADFFAGRGAGSFGNRSSASRELSVTALKSRELASGSMLAPRANGLFVPRSDALLKR